MRHVDVLAHRSQRVVSVDALRGFNFIWILGGDGAMWALADMTQDKAPALRAVGGFLGRQLNHVAVGRLPLLRFHLPAVHLHHRRLHRAVAAAPARARGQDAGPSAGAAPRAAALWPGVDLLRRHQARLGRHPLPRRAATHRDLLPGRLAAVPEFQSARVDRRLRRAHGRLLGGDELRAGARRRRPQISARTTISPTGSTRIICPGACGTSAAIRKGC